jgi:phage portal protein BeeE
MPKLWRSLLGRPEERSDGLMTMDQWSEMFNFGGLNYMMTGTSASIDTESIENSFIGYINGLYKTNGVVFALMEARRSIFSEARFQFQRINKGRPGDLFGSPALNMLEYPWPNATTGELLSRAIQDVDLAGNHYLVREPKRFRRLRPDWVQILLSAPPADAVQSDVIGYAYWPGGIGYGKPQIYFPEEMAHWCPIPDPEAQYRGMSWLTPVIREVQSDKQATEHKAKFYSNAATPKLSVSLKDNVTKAQFLEFMEAFEAANGGIENAYKTIYLGGGADVNLVGANMVQMDFKNVQGAGETRMAAAAGVPAVVVGFSEGLQGSSLNEGNYKAAKENFADKTMRPLWRSISASYQTLVAMPSSNGTVRLWYDDRDIAFLRTDRLEAAKIMTEESSSIIKFVTGGFTPESSVAAVTSGDSNLLEHTGLVSVQLLPPGQVPPGTDTTPGAPGSSPELPPGKTAPLALPPGKTPPTDGATPAAQPAQANASRWVLVDLEKYAVRRLYDQPIPPAETSPAKDPQSTPDTAPKGGAK